MEIKKTIKFTEEDIEVMNKVQNILDNLCQSVTISDCEFLCPFYKICKKGLTIKEACFEMINRSTDCHID